MGSEFSLRMSLPSRDRALVPAPAASSSSREVPIPPEQPGREVTALVAARRDAGGFAGWMVDRTGPCLLALHVPTPWRGDRDIMRVWLL